MYKSKLQVLCQQRKWLLPEYDTSKVGVEHNPRFCSVVTINGLSFGSAERFRSSKEAQNNAARLAFDHFSNPEPIPFGRIPIHSSSSEILQPQMEETNQNPQVPVQLSVQASGSQSEGNNSKLDLANHKGLRGIQHLYKNNLQTYAQKRNLLLPMYSCEREGPPHASRFKCSVTIDGQTYVSQEFLPTIKEAEHAAARVALMALFPDGVEEEDDSHLYKNLLQELFQKDGLLPIYSTSRFGEIHKPIFVSTVEIGRLTFAGQEAKSKKRAEMSAAKVAYHALRERKSSEIPLTLSTTQQGKEALDILSSSFQSNPAADLQHRALEDAPILPKMIIQEQTYARVTAKGKSHHPTSVPSGPDDLMTAGGFSSFDGVYGVSQSCPSSISSSDVSRNLVVDPTAERPAKKSMSSYEKVSVYPRQPNMTFPVGTTLLSASDDQWVALSHT